MPELTQQDAYVLFGCPVCLGGRGARLEALPSAPACAHDGFLVFMEPIAAALHPREWAHGKAREMLQAMGGAR